MLGGRKRGLAKRTRQRKSASVQLPFRQSLEGQTLGWVVPGDDGVGHISVNSMVFLTRFIMCSVLFSPHEYIFPIW